MSTRERPKKDKEKDAVSKQSEPIEDWLDDIQPKSDVTSKPQKPQQVSTEVKKLDQLLAEFTRRLPKWINKPWMYVKPTHEGHLNSWYNSWKKLVLTYCEILSRHVVNIYDLHDIHPFTHQTNGKDLSLDEIQYIIESMVEENLAKWLDDETIRARIYYKTDEEWAEIIHNFTIEEGYAIEVMTLYELRNLDEPWTSLPISELRVILDILVNDGKAEWIGQKRDAIQFLIQ